MDNDKDEICASGYKRLLRKFLVFFLEEFQAPQPGITWPAVGK